jgi:hypothetical protein
VTLIFWIFVAIVFAVELYLYAKGASEGRNHIADQLHQIISVARDVYKEISDPHERVNRFCGTVVGLVVLFATAWIVISTLSSILVPFELDEWRQRLFFAVSSLAAGVFSMLLAKKLNDWLVPKR